MKYLKKYDEGFIDWITNKFKKEEPEDTDTDDNKIAKGIIKTIIPSIDPDNIEFVEATYDNGNKNSINVKLGGGSNLYLTKYYSNYALKVDDDEILCDDGDYKDKSGKVTRTNYKRVIYEQLLKKYKDEQARVRFQRISTNVGL